MTDRELFDKMAAILKVFKASKGQVIDFSNNLDEHSWIPSVYRHIMNNPGATVNMGCGSCVSHILNIFVSYYEREYSKWFAEHQPKETETATELETSVVSDPAPASNRKRSGKNTKNKKA